MIAVSANVTVDKRTYGRFPTSNDLCQLMCDILSSTASPQPSIRKKLKLKLG